MHTHTDVCYLSVHKVGGGDTLEDAAQMSRLEPGRHGLCVCVRALCSLAFVTEDQSSRHHAQFRRDLSRRETLDSARGLGRP